MPEKYKRISNIQCIICSKEIYRRPNEIKRYQGRVFCSKDCFGISCRKEQPCSICGKPILAGLHKKTCSRSCANKLRVGSKYKQNKLKDKVVFYQSLKKRLINLRGSTCERCKYDKIEILQVHHKDRNRKNNDLYNLELICPNCHFEEHYLENSWLRKI